MDKISGRGRAGFRRLLSGVFIGLAAHVWPCYAQESRSLSPQETEQLQREQERIQQAFQRRKEQLRQEQLQRERLRAQQIEAAETERKAQEVQRKMQGLPFGAPPQRAPAAPILCDSAIAEACLQLYLQKLQRRQLN
jgi:hypothetical protein